MGFKQICPIKVQPQNEIEMLPFFLNGDYNIEIFDPLTIKFLDQISRRILKDARLNRIAEVVALAYWLRKSNIENLRQEKVLSNKENNGNLSPIGKVFHVCPANVDTMFFYSLVVSLLMGNKNLLRISERMNAFHVDLLFQFINEVLAEPQYKELESYINIVSYGHDDEISAFISSNVNGRIIWGGDNTINKFKSFSTAPRTRDILFADRVSLMVFNFETYQALDSTEKIGVLKNFYNDSYTFDQMGCSSPQTIFFLGQISKFESFLSEFTKDLSDYVLSKYNGDVFSISSLKLNRLVDDALEGMILGQFGDNLVKFVLLSQEVDESQLHGCGGGYFYVKQLNDIEEIKLSEKKKIQTITYFGISNEQLQKLTLLSFGEGIDRIVPLGEALNFHYIWDGYDLFNQLSRKIFIK